MQFFSCAASAEFASRLLSPSGGRYKAEFDKRDYEGDGEIETKELALVGAAAIPLPWLCRGSCMLMPPRPPPARARRRSQPEGQVMKALGRELSAAAAKMLIQAHPRPLLAEDHPRSGRGLTVFSPGPPRNGWSTAGAAARLDSSSATSRRRRECTVGTRVGATVGRGGGLQSSLLRWGRDLLAPMGT